MVYVGDMMVVCLKIILEGISKRDEGSEEAPGWEVDELSLRRAVGWRRLSMNESTAVDRL
jgi:hypothetical protein